MSPIAAVSPPTPNAPPPASPWEGSEPLLADARAEDAAGEAADALDALRWTMHLRGEVDAGAFLARSNRLAGVPPRRTRSVPALRSADALGPDDPVPNHFPIETFLRDGYCRLGVCLGPSAVEALDAAADRALHAAFRSSGMPSWAGWLARITQVPEPVHWDQGFVRLERHPTLLAAAAAALHAPTVVCAWSHLVLKPPGGHRDLPWHTDRPTWPLPEGVEGVAIWMPLDPVGPDSGGLRYRPGTHRGWTADTLPGEVDPGSFLAGEALLHHADVLHASPPNRSSTWRRAWIGVFVPADSPDSSPQAG